MTQTDSVPSVDMNVDYAGMNRPMRALHNLHSHVEYFFSDDSDWHCEPSETLYRTQLPSYPHTIRVAPIQDETSPESSPVGNQFPYVDASGFDFAKKMGVLYGMAAGPMAGGNYEREENFLRQRFEYQNQERPTNVFTSSMGMGTISALRKEVTKRAIFKAKSHERVLRILAESDLELHAEDYYAHLQSRQEHLEEGESPGVILQSLQSWVWFLIDFAQPRQLPYAKFDADFDGCVELSWRLSGESIQNDPDNEYYGNGRGLVHITFFPSHLNYLSVFSGAYVENRHRIGFDGWFSHTKTKQVLDTFMERFQSAKRSVSPATSGS